MGNDIASLERALQALAGAAAAAASACTLQGCDAAAVCRAARVVDADAAAAARCCMARPPYAAALCQLLQAAARDAATGVVASFGDATGCGDVIGAIHSAVDEVLFWLADGVPPSAPSHSATPAGAEAAAAAAAAEAEAASSSSTSLPLAYAMGSALLQSGVLASLAKGAGRASQCVAGQQQRSRRSLTTAYATAHRLDLAHWAVLTPHVSASSLPHADATCNNSGWYERQLVQQLQGSASLEHMCKSVACLCHALLQQASASAASAAIRRRRPAAGGQGLGGGPGPNEMPGLGQPAHNAGAAAEEEAAAGPRPSDSHCAHDAANTPCQVRMWVRRHGAMGVKGPLPGRSHYMGCCADWHGGVQARNAA